MFKAMVCLCLLSGSWAGPQHSARTSQFGNKPLVKPPHCFGLALARLPVHMTRFETSLEWGGDGAWEPVTGTAQNREADLDN